MDVSVKHSNASQLGREEGFFHYIAREGRTALRWLIGICLVAIVLCMVSPGFYFLAVVPALLLLGSYVLLVLTNELERRSDTEAHEVLERHETAITEDIVEDHTEDHQLPRASVEIVKRESRTAVAILVAVMITAALVAAVLFDWKVAAIGALVVFAYMLLIAAPLWAGWFNDDIEITAHRIADREEPPSVKTGEPS